MDTSPAWDRPISSLCTDHYELTKLQASKRPSGAALMPARRNHGGTARRRNPAPAWRTRHSDYLWVRAAPCAPISFRQIRGTSGVDAAAVQLIGDEPEQRSGGLREIPAVVRRCHLDALKERRPEAHQLRGGHPGPATERIEHQFRAVAMGERTVSAGQFRPHAARFRPALPASSRRRPCHPESRIISTASGSAPVSFRRSTTVWRPDPNEPARRATAIRLGTFRTVSWPTGDTSADSELRSTATVMSSLLVIVKDPLESMCGRLHDHF